MRGRNRQKRVILIFTVSCVAAVLGFAIYAAISSKLVKTVENEFNPDEITLAVVENNDSNTASTVTKAISWSEDSSSTPTKYTATKKIQITNVDESDTNNADAYIRVALIPSYISNVIYTDENNTEQEQEVSVISGNYELSGFGELTDITINNNTFTMGNVTFTLDSEWEDRWFFNHTDGYFYYREIVEPGETTDPLLANVSILSDTYNILKTYGMQLEVDVITDAIQTQGGALDARWTDAGVTIDTDDTLKQGTS